MTKVCLSTRREEGGGRCCRRGDIHNLCACSNRIRVSVPRTPSPFVLHFRIKREIVVDGGLPSLSSVQCHVALPLFRWMDDSELIISLEKEGAGYTLHFTPPPPPALTYSTTLSVLQTVDPQHSITLHRACNAE